MRYLSRTAQRVIIYGLAQGSKGVTWADLPCISYCTTPVVASQLRIIPSQRGDKEGATQVVRYRWCDTEGAIQVVRYRGCDTEGATQRVRYRWYDTECTM